MNFWMGRLSQILALSCAERAHATAMDIIRFGAGQLTQKLLSRRIRCLEFVKELLV